MRALLMMVILAFTYVMAGMYQSAPLAVLAGTELASAVVLSFLPLCFRRTVRVSFTDRLASAMRGADAVCRLTVRNTGPLPAGRMELRLLILSPGERRGLRRKLYGGAERGENQMEFRLRTPYCGLVLLRLDRVRYYDYLNLFSLPRRTAEELRVAVYPPEQPLRIPLPDGDGGAGAQLHTSSLPGDGGGEIRKLREYQAGDPIRRVHWNLSARMDALWMKEFERDAVSRALVLLDGAPPEDLEAADAYYRLLSGVLLGLLDLPAAVRVVWGRGPSPRSMEITERGQVRELLLTLYLSPPDGRPDLDAGPGEHALRLSGDLELSINGYAVYRFSPETLDRDLEAGAHIA